MAKSRFTGRDRMRKVLKALPASVRQEVSAAVMDGAEGIADIQRSLVKVKTGRLKRSIKVTRGDRNPPAYASLRSKRTNPDPELAAIITAGDDQARHAHLVEFGTAPHIAGGEMQGAEHPGAKAQPFFYPGFRAGKKPAQAKINRAARKGIKEGLK